VAPDGSSTTTYLYQGNTVKVTDAAGKWKLFTQDAMGNLVQVNEPNPSPGGGADYITTYTYNPFDKLINVSMPRPTGTQTRTFSYSGAYLMSKTEPETGTTQFNYNSDGTLNYKLDANGNKTVMVYDSSKRVTRIRKLIGSNGDAEDLCQRVDFYYDTNPFDALYSQYTNGRVAAVEYRGKNCDLQNGNSYLEMYSYTRYGAMTKKRFRLTRNLRANAQQPPQLVAKYAELESIAGYDAEGRLETIQYPLTNRVVKYSFDSRGLPNKLRDETAGMDLVASVTYGLAGELATFGGETRSYNVNGQLTTINMGSRSITYNYPAAGANNGKIASMVDSGETVTYQYDSLQRLTSAAGSGWTQSYSYDGFGNLLSKTGTGTAPSWSVGINPLTNRTTNVNYDANGNQLVAPAAAGMPESFNLTYDTSNRLIDAVSMSQWIQYEYDAGNKRILEVSWTGNGNGWTKTGDSVHFYGITGQRLGTYAVYVTNEGFSSVSLAFLSGPESVWFGGRLVQKNGGPVAAPDRLGSIGRYLPYGEERTGQSGNPANGNEKFATYTRDGVTGLDYADQRWYAQGQGRFLTSDPSEPGDASDPSSWNFYSYTPGDPTNFIDPEGLDIQGLQLTYGREDCSSRVVSWLQTIPASPYSWAEAEFRKWRANPAEFFANSDAGMMALHSWFEWRGDYTTPEADANIWESINNVWRNRWLLPDWLKRRYGFSTGAFKSLFTQYQSAENPWQSDRQLKSAFRNVLMNVLGSAPDSGVCEGFLQAMRIGVKVWASPASSVRDVAYGDPGDPSEGALFYKSVNSGGTGPLNLRWPTVRVSVSARARTKFLRPDEFWFFTIAELRGQ
jgi:RHS repeat-associated protein